MKLRLMGLMAVMLAVFATTSAAATQLAGSGCCPLCK
jgi:hypothetical protein